MLLVRRSEKSVKGDQWDGFMAVCRKVYVTTRIGHRWRLGTYNIRRVIKLIINK